MNAGAMGGWMFDVVEEVQVVDYAGDVRTLRRAEMHVDYRHCAELHDAIALGALLKPASQAEAAAIARQIEAYKDKRQKSQPREPSAGCIFKNPPGDSAGRLIDVSGLKGERIGDAEVSPVHANFIVNRGEATAADVIALVKRVRARVAEAKGVVPSRGDPLRQGVEGRVMNFRFLILDFRLDAAVGVCAGGRIVNVGENRKPKIPNQK